MNKLRQKLLACVALGLMATPAHAITFDFIDGPFGNLTDVLNYEESGLTLQITASTQYTTGSEYSNSTDDDPTVQIGQYGQYGLGVVNARDYSNYWNNQPLAVDGQKGTDRLNLLFGEKVELKSLEFYYYGDNQNFNLFEDEDNNGELDEFPEEFHFNINGEITFEGLIGVLFGIGAGDTEIITNTEYYRKCTVTWGGGGHHHHHHANSKCEWKQREVTDHTYSAFKLVSLSVDKLDLLPPPEVPLPASLPLFGTGLALMGYLGMRRRKKANA